MTPLLLSEVAPEKQAKGSGVRKLSGKSGTQGLLNGGGVQTGGGGGLPDLSPGDKRAVS